MINIDQLSQKPIETLFAVFYNTVQDKYGNFEIQSNYRESKFLKMPSDSYITTATQLSKKYLLDFQYDSGTTIIATILNNKNWDLETFLDAIYTLILTRLTKIPENYLLDVELALALFIFRGSADFNRGYYSVDLKGVTLKHYLDNFFKLLLSSDDLLSRLNLNFRELQPEFYSGKNLRNTQIRINLKWFYDNVIAKFEYINQYKADLLTENITILGDTREYHNFEERLIFYRESVLGRELTDDEVRSLREELEFSLRIETGAGTPFILRNQKIVSFARETFKDICVGCGDRYDIADRSFKMPRNGRYYFEINHVIPYSNDSATVDVLDNLVKLCPTCHRALSPGRAYENFQKNIIKKMIYSRREVTDFVVSMMPKTALSPVDYVYSMLK